MHASQESTKDRVRREAVRLFAERGIDAVSQRDIAAAAGLQVSTLYAHWKGGRDQLIAELFVAGYAEYAQVLADAAAPHADFASALEAMVRRICGLQTEDRALFAFLLLSQHRALDGVAYGGANPVDVLHARVEAAIGRREIPDADPTLLTAAIVGVIVQAATFRLYGRLAKDLEPMADAVVALCFRVAGLEPPAQARTRP
ncbi:TetR/AcrR family transcriptional regulator [Plastoroseomonas hellenica]|uniref:TetR/AcrR family transcriptional regulator n=1 Tax=Plastoroseomonas hellenica TaxID=2687306 RepID=UPI001BA915AD|nr:TetR/AcrR family transcriptional regulator [Plastoroseomonas hellenica]MBR0642893.1 TetR/AcrR family transcriptional regulator [Plastoroseomonas hellenica]